MELTEKQSPGGTLKLRAEMNNSHLFLSVAFVFIFKLLLTAFQKFALMLTKMCQYNEN